MLSYLPLDAVTNNRFLADFFGNNQAKPWLSKLIFCRVNAEVRIVRALPLLKYVFEFGRFE